MGYKLKYKEINDVRTQILKDTADMRASLNQLKEAVKAVGNSPNIEGPAAENIKRYVT